MCEANCAALWEGRDDRTAIASVMMMLSSVKFCRHAVGLLMLQLVVMTMVVR